MTMPLLPEADLAVARIVAGEIYPAKGWIAVFERNKLLVILNRERCYRAVAAMFETYGEAAVRREVHSGRRLHNDFIIRFVPFDAHQTLEAVKKALQANANG